MTVAEIIGLVDETRPNQYDTDIKVQWLNEVEHKVYDEVLNRAEGNNLSFTPYAYDADAEEVVMIPDQYADVYLNYLYAKIDYTQNEIGRANNDMAMFNASWGEYAGWYRRHHMPKKVMR